MKKFLLVLAGIVLASASAFSIESDFKNSLLKVDFTRVGGDNYNILLHTQKPYSEPIKVIKKTNTNYYLLLPETFHSVSSVAPVGDIKSVEVKLFPYAGQDLNNGYTKINIYTTKPVNISTGLKTASGAIAPSIDAKKLAQLDNAFNTKQAQQQAQERQAQFAAQQKQIQEQKARALKEQQVKEAQLKAQKEAQAKALAQKEAAQRAQAQKEAEQKAQIEAQKRAEAQKVQAARLAAQKAQLEEQKKAEQIQAQKQAALKAQQLKAQQLKEQQAKEAARIKALEEEKTRAAQQKLAQQKAEQQKTEQQKQAQQKADKLKAEQEAQRIAQEQKAKEIQKSTAVPEPEVQKPQADEVQIPNDVIVEEIDKTEAVSTPISETPEKSAVKASFVEIIKDKLSPLRPYYYILIDNLVLAIASIVAMAGILMLIIINKNKKKGQDTNMEAEQTITNDTDTTEKSDLEALKYDINSTNPLLQKEESVDYSDNMQTFKDDLSSIANEYEVQETVVKTVEQEPVREVYEEPYVEPVVLSSVEIAPNRGFMIIDRQGIKALFGYIHDEVFLLYQFREYIADYNIKFRISEKQDDKTFFIVKIDKFKLLIRVTSGNMKLELEM